MPLTGNRLGSKTRVVYTSDTGAEYNMRIDPDLVISNSGLVAGSTGSTPPSRFSPRVVFAQLEEAGKIYRKKLVAGTNDSGLYATNTPQVIVIDTASFTTTGRKGEKQTF